MCYIRAQTITLFDKSVFKKPLKKHVEMFSRARLVLGPAQQTDCFAPASASSCTQYPLCLRQHPIVAPILFILFTASSSALAASRFASENFVVAPTLLPSARQSAWRGLWQPYFCA